MKIVETLYAEVTQVSRDRKYLNGYGSPATEVTTISISSEKASTDQTFRIIRASLPGNLPIGTQFKITLEQIDEVTPATIHRGALPIIEDKKLIEAQQVTNDPTAQPKVADLQANKEPF